MNFTEKTVEKKLIYDGRIIRVFNDTVELQNGRLSKREVVEHPGGVGIVPVDSDGNVYLVRQYRYPMEKELLEIPAGKLEYGEDPLECAVRELSEETGFSADNYVNLGASLPSPGYCKETLYVYLATGLKKGKMHLDENEFLNVEKYSFDELVKKVMKNEILDGKTIIGLLKAYYHLNGAEK